MAPLYQINHSIIKTLIIKRHPTKQNSESISFHSFAFIYKLFGTNDVGAFLIFSFRLYTLHYLQSLFTLAR